MLMRGGDPLSKATADPIASNYRVTFKVPPYEIYPTQGPAQEPTRFEPKINLPDTNPKVAIVIDDVGYDKKMAYRFLNLGVELSFSLLPHSPFQKEITEALFAKGFDVMLHLPMEPHEYTTFDPGMDVLLTPMRPDAFVGQLIGNLDAVSHIKGVNNHMGSKMTENMDLMLLIFSVLKERGLFFLDSRTTRKSICNKAADQLGLRFVQRDIFLDHIPTREFILSQVDALVEKATAQGLAIGIAHPYEITFQTLNDILPALTQKVDIVPISTIVEAANPS
jgi:polysaccharide deacetylase 2 family uncharacterized protein YibQ